MLDKDVSRFVKICILTLGLDNPVSVRVKSGSSYFDPDHKSRVMGSCLSDNGKHKITVCHGSSRYGMLELIAHELCHAWVDENHPRAEFHGRTWQRTTAALRRALRDWGFYLGPLYRKGVDT